MTTASLDAIKSDLLQAGFQKKAILDSAAMKRALVAFDAQSGVTDTPPEELRYIEGLLDLPLGHLKFFKVVPASGSNRCQCGRISSALEIVRVAVKYQLHSRDLIRDTLLGYQNVFEIADGGRLGECISCGRPVKMLGYAGEGYIYT